MKTTRLEDGTLFCERSFPGGKAGYRLTADRAEDGGTAYTLSVRRISPGGEEECVLPDLAPSRETATRLFRLFADRLVLPEEAPFVYDDLCAAGGADSLPDPAK
ncbi:MAG: hypothetical protein II192_07085 [Clostridia bacterium]|nr:hypothetical protein [Clostridia bacterium]